MKSIHARMSAAAGAMVLALAALTAVAAEEAERGYTMPPQQGQHMMGGYGYGYGMGPGMMGGYGGMGPGMMGGYGGMGPGMMGGYGGMGAGMMGMGPIWMLNLSEEQQSKLGAIMDDMHKQQWALMGKMIEGRSWLRDLYAKDKPDPKQVGDAYAKLFEIQRQMIENGVAAHNRMYDILTKEQQEELQNLRRGAGGYGYGPRGRMPYGGGMMGPGMMGNQ